MASDCLYKFIGRNKRWRRRNMSKSGGGNEHRKRDDCRINPPISNNAHRGAARAASMLHHAPIFTSPENVQIGVFFASRPPSSASSYSTHPGKIKRKMEMGLASGLNTARCLLSMIQPMRFVLTYFWMAVFTVSPVAAAVVPETAPTPAVEPSAAEQGKDVVHA